MPSRKIRKEAVIRAQREEIRAQSIRIEWLLQVVQVQRDCTGTIASQTLSEMEVRCGDD